MPLRDLFLLNPDVVFLNHGSFGACPREVFTAYQDWQLQIERQPVEFFARRYYDVMREAREVLAGFIGCAPNDVAYVPNATVALNEVGRAIPLEPGDEVLASVHEYPAFENMWPYVCAARGAHYVHQPVTLPITSAEQVVEEIWQGVTSKTKALFISHISSPTAIMFPVAELVRRCREAGIISIIDGAHGPGQADLNLRELDPDFYAANCHKWMMTPKGSGFLYVRKDKQELVDPPWLFTSEGRREMPGATTFVMHHDYQGTRDVSAYLATADSVRFMAKHDWNSVRKDCHELLRYARQQVQDLTGIEPITPDSTDWYVQLASLPIPPVDTPELKNRLLKEFNVEVPIIAWNDRHFVRVSVQGYVTKQDIDTLLEGLKTLLPQVAV